jgi:anti-sigma factor RsiW
MKHPSHEEWVPYVFGEATPDARKRLSAHLDACPECQAEIAGWQRSLKKLDGWKLPRPSRSQVETAQPLLRWAMAALIVLGVGFGLGRFFTPSDTESSRASLEASVRTSLSAELQSALDQVRMQSTHAIAAAEARLATASETEVRRLARGLMEAMNSARQEDRRTTQAMLETLQRQQEAELISIRTDLETVASLTDEEIRQAQMKLIQIAAGNSSTP